MGRVLAQFVSVGLDHGIMWDPLKLLLPLGFRSPHQRTPRASQKNLELAYRPSGHRLVRARAELHPPASLVRSDFVLTARRDFISLVKSHTGY